MSSIVLSGDTSGTVTVAVPAVAGTNTVTIAAQTGTLNAAGPAFSAYLNSTQSVSSSVWTKVQLNNEVFDTNNNFDSTTNYRFTPTIAGYYLFTGSIAAFTGTTYMGARLYLNGNIISQSFADSTSGYSSSVNCILYMNGSTDYVELYGFFSSAGSFYGTTSQAYTYLQGSLIRGT